MTDLAFPEIDQATSTQVATTAPATLKDTALASFVPIEAHMRTLAARFKDVAYDVTTTKGMKDAKAARLVLRDEGRYAVQRLQKRLKDEANDLKRTLDARADELIAITKPVEDAIDRQITAEEERKEAERAERERIERERVERLQARIAGLSAWIDRCKAPDMTAARIASGIQMLQQAPLGDDWQEFADRAAARKAEVLEVMGEIHAQAVAREQREAEARAEADRLEAQRIENERVAAENARVAAELKRQADELAAAKAYTEGQGAQQVLKAEPATADATDRAATVDASPSGGSMGAGLGAWVPVAERMPASGKVVLACYRNTHGHWRRIRACWVAAKTEESGSESEIGEYDETTDTYYDPEGWYEQIDNWPDYTACAVHEGEVSHWMPLPAPPQSAQRSR